ncbi:hypothetical protein [uncultured Nostoc sp.]|uniref:hypothetical protein n=1 Tax=uncultured Nostoc sp. TaxID=340711 RepID=UPI0035CB0571
MSSKKSLEIMLTEKHITIREATTKEDSLIAKHSYQMWLDIGVDESNRPLAKVFFARVGKRLKGKRTIQNLYPFPLPLFPTYARSLISTLSGRILPCNL